MRLPQGRSIVRWILQLVVAAILFQTLFFKFTGVLALGVISGPIFSQTTALGIVVFLASSIVLLIRRPQIPVIGSALW